MLRKYTSFIFLFLLFISCTPHAVKGELPPHSELTKELIQNQEKQLVTLQSTNLYQINYEIFRLNLLTSLSRPYTNIDPSYLRALQNEFDHFALDPKENLNEALKTYADLILKDPSETNIFLLQRAGVVYFKLGIYSRASSFLAKCLLSGEQNPELFYYKALLSAYHDHDYRTAAWYLKRIPANKTIIPAQDILYFQGKMEEEQGNFAAAERFYLSAIQDSPSRFYILYDILPFYVKWDKMSQAGKYISDSFAYLTSLSNNQYNLKAYRQKMEYNASFAKNNLRYQFKIESPYNYFPNLYMFMRSPGLAAKRLSDSLVLPVNEQKNTRADVLMYLTMEDLYDAPDTTGLVIIAGGLSITNFRYAKKRLYTPVTKHFFYTNVVALMSPTNQYFVITNHSRSTNHPEYIVTNIDNALYKQTLKFKYYMDNQKFDVDGDSNWDYLIFGINNSNQIGMSIFYPALRKTETYMFPLTRYNAELYVDDINADGKKEIVLLDDAVYFLKPESVVK